MPRVTREDDKRLKNAYESKISQAVRMVGGQSEAARRLGVQRTTVHWWLKRGAVPLHRVALVERIACGHVTAEELIAESVAVHKARALSRVWA